MRGHTLCTLTCNLSFYNTWWCTDPKVKFTWKGMPEIPFVKLFQHTYGLIVVMFVDWRKVVFHTKVNTCTVCVYIYIIYRLRIALIWTVTMSINLVWLIRSLTYQWRWIQEGWEQHNIYSQQSWSYVSNTCNRRKTILPSQEKPKEDQVPPRYIKLLTLLLHMLYLVALPCNIKQKSTEEPKKGPKVISAG